MELKKEDMDPDTWILYQVRKRSPTDYQKLADHVRTLPNPIRDIDAKVRKLIKEIELLKAEREKLAADCKHVAWNSEDGHDYTYEDCIQCGKQEVI